MRFAAAVLLLALALPARADVLLDGSQHIGDNSSATFTPSDPVTIAEFSGSPSRFYLSQNIVVTAVRLENFVGANKPIHVEIDNRTIASSSVNGLITLTTPLTLSGGTVHLLDLDPGCLRGGAQEFGNRCRNQDDEYDIGFSAITLITQSAAQTTLARNLNQRRHLGDTTDFANDNFGGRWYPDAPEGARIDTPFSIDSNRRLTEVRFYRLRDTGANNQVLSRATVSLIDPVANTVTVLGTLTRDANPFIISTAVPLATGNYVIRVDAGQMKSPTSDQDKNLDDLRWNDIVLVMATNLANVPGNFNSVDPGQDAVTGVVTTRIAGTPLNVDVVALSNGAIVTTYTGTVTIDLLDASDDSGTLDAFGCRSSWVVSESLGTLTFAAADNGRKLLAAEVADAYPKARLRMRDLALNVSGCTTDLFAVRPASFTLQVTDQDADTPGTARALNAVTATASPTHKAGRPFTILATALNAHGAVTPGYVGSPTVLATAAVLGSAIGEVRADPWTSSGGTARSDNARYNEAGAFTLEVRDTTFAAADAGDGTPSAQLQVGPYSIDVGRFTPDHFEVAVNAPQFAPACGAFTYVGQPFQYALTPSATLSAAAYGLPVTVTQNYAGSLYKLPATVAPSAYTALDPVSGSPSAAALDVSSLPTPDNTLVGTGAGQATLTLLAPSDGVRFVRGTPVAAFNAEIAVTSGAIVDGDGITTSAPVSFGSAATGSGIAFAGGANGQRFGRLVVDNAYGSEQLPLNVPLRAEYWASFAGATGFVASAGDACTTLASGNVALTANPPGLGSTVTAVQSPGAASGTGFVTLSPPNATGSDRVRVDLSATLLPWLRADWDGNGTWNDDSNDPVGLASFGRYHDSDKRIYQREVIGP